MAVKGLKSSGVELLNAVRTSIIANNGLEYADRIPVATQENLKDMGKAILDYQPAKNAFLDNLINRIGLPKDENGQEIPREKLRKCVYELCTKTYTNTVNLRTLAEELWHDADYLTQYAEENNIKINDQFDIDRDEIKKLNGYSVAEDNIKLTFPSEYMGKKVRFDKNNSDVIIIESHKLSTRLKEEL